LGKIQSEVDKIYKTQDLGIIIVDYLNQVKRNTGSKNGQYEWTEQIEIAKALKAMAQEYNVPVVSPYQIDASGEARFAKGVLDSCDAAFTMNTWSHGDNCITFDCVKMRNNELKSFTSEVDWSSLKIGPNTALTPKEKEASKKSSSEEPNEVF
jgi:replicative DNA helicase